MFRPVWAMLMPIYSLALAMVLLLGTPWWIFRMLTTARYREGLGERLGRVPAALRASVLGKRTVWLHAVSVGEVLAAATLIAELEAALGPGWKVVVSTTTRTGQRLARERFGMDRVFYFPLDFRFAVCCWLQVLRPELLILAESELWPRLLHECGRLGIPVAVVNARISDRTLRRSLRFRMLWRWMAGHVTLWLAQSDADAQRVLRLGIAPGRVCNTGNLKYDTRPPRESPLVAAIRQGAAGRLVVVAGSTVAWGTTPEESIVLEAFRSHVWVNMPGVLLILAPRHPERFTEAGVLAATFGSMICATDMLPAAAGEAPRQPPLRLNDERILVLDTIGDLAAVYGLADAAFIGGSLLPHGGHNPLEPAQFGVPVVMGPHVENFRDIVAHLQAADGIVILPDTEPEPLGEALAQLLLDRHRAEAIGAHGREVCDQQRGATARTVAALLPLLRAESSQASQAASLGPSQAGSQAGSQAASPSPDPPNGDPVRVRTGSSARPPVDDSEAELP